MDPIFYVIIFGLALALYIVVSYFINISKEKLIYDEIEAFCLKNNWQYNKPTSKIYNIVISNETVQMYICICKIPTNSSVTINSKDTWCLRFGGGKRKGRNYPSKRYLSELTPFLKAEIEPKENKEVIKVIVLYPTTEVILKYVNESDIVEVKTTDYPYDYKVIRYRDFMSNFNDLLIKKKKA